MQVMGYIIGGRKISNIPYADETALIAQSPMEIQQLVVNVNDAGGQLNYSEIECREDKTHDRHRRCAS